MGLPQILSVPLIFTGLGIYVVYLVVLVVQRLYLSPIAHIPGPKIAAVSFWYEFYYDVILHGQYIWRVRDMHREYGPIIRINPYELHVLDLEFVDEIWAGSNRKRDKWNWVTSQLGEGVSTLTTNSHDIHRLRRGALNPFFSKSSVRSLQPLIDRNAQLLLKRIEDFKENGKVMNFDLAMAAFTNDIVTEYAFGYSHNRLNHPDFDRTFHDRTVEGFSSGHLLKHFPWIRHILEAMPTWVAAVLVPAYYEYIQEKKMVINDATNVINAREGSSRNSEVRTIYSEILDSRLSPIEKTPYRLSEESHTTVAAGTLTTAWALSVATYFLLSTPVLLQKLRDELEVAMPDATAHASLVTLESLPYLTALIKETLRLSYGVTDRCSRIATDEELFLQDGKKMWTIPRGTPVSMTIPLLNHDESIFPDSRAFRPERWLENPDLDHYMVSMGRGSRSCAGANLAWAELYLTFAALFRNYGSAECRKNDDLGILRLYDTTYRDIDLAADNIIPTVWEGSKGIRVIVTD